MISLLIKGNRNDAFRAASRACVPLVFREYARTGEVLAIAPDAYLDNVLVWFCEDDRPPYRAGALLWYQVKPGRD